MKIRNLLLPVLLLASTAASAHAKLESSMPADKSRVAAPKELAMGFTDAVVLTSLTLQHGKEPAKPLQLPESLQVEYGWKVPLPALAPGDYAIAWKAESDDTHTASGVIHFTVVAGGKDAQQK